MSLTFFNLRRRQAAAKAAESKAAEEKKTVEKVEKESKRRGDIKKRLPV